MISIRKLRGLCRFQEFRRLMSSNAVESKEDEKSGPAWTSVRGGLEDSSTLKDKEGAPTSFVQNLFLGKFDTSILTYPEVLEKERHEWLHSTIVPIQNYFKDNVDSMVIDSEAKISDDILKELKGLGLFGQEIPVEYGGLGLNVTEHSRVSEIIGLDTSIGRTLASHQAIGAKALLMFGTEEQKKKYLPRLASGEQIAAFCMTEDSSGSDMSSMKTVAKLSTDGKMWHISGTKTMVTNGQSADLFLVFAKTAADTLSDSSFKRISAFVVEREFGGVTSGELQDKMGARGSETCAVTFDNTPVPMENVIGGIGEGFKVASGILNHARLNSACLALGFLKEMINNAAKHVIKREQFGKSLSEFQLIREKLSRMTISAYVMESMIYMTAGIIDKKSFEDTSLETSILKIISSEGCWQGANEYLQIFGGQGYMKGSMMEIAIRDARLFPLIEQTNEILRLYIGSVGIQYSGQNLRDFVKKIRQPFQYPGLALITNLKRGWNEHNATKLKLKLNEFLHPTLFHSADLLESCLIRLKQCVETVFYYHGAEVINAQSDLRRLADITIELYSMTAVLSRASRSYCIGLRDAQSEMHIAEVFCDESFDRVRMIAKQIDDGEYLTPDRSLTRVAEAVLTNKGYFAQHPLARNFW